jgi:hypothetical protein
MIELKEFGQNIDMVEFEKLMVKNHIDDKIIEITNAIFLLDKNKMLVDERLFLEMQFLTKLKERLKYNPEYIEQVKAQNSELILKNLELESKINELMELL